MCKCGGSTVQCTCLSILVVQLSLSMCTVLKDASSQPIKMFIALCTYPGIAVQSTGIVKLVHSVKKMPLLLKISMAAQNSGLH